MAYIKAPSKVFPISAFISDLPSNLFPPSLQLSSENGPVTGRLVIIGDVHGMRKSLEALLDKINFDKSKGDHLILTGDLINKGPDSPGVVDIAMRLGASAVRGNHENAVLNAAAEIDATRDKLHSGDLNGSPPASENLATDLPKDTFKGEVPEECPPSNSHNTALALSKRQLDWLADLPFILRVKLPHTLTSSLGDTLLVVHAGLVPSIPLEEQDPHAILHMRSLTRTSGDEDEFKAAELPGEESWVIEWDRWQDTLTSKTTVVFGHDAKRRLQLGSYTIGLDSGCLYGHHLSAVVIAASQGEIEHRVVQVECADEPVAPTTSVKEDR
ncbi:hypothetical protein N7526_000976 [Penicillium atrosanguineum]|nr:hypothetical protein N7526_000976 [Penicillium atrosanguineum]